MTLHNEILEGGLNNSLAKRLGMQTGTPAPSLTPEIFPVIQVGVAWEELAFNQGWRRWNTCMVNAGGANPNRYLLNNPAGSNVLCVIERLQVVGPAAGATIWRLDAGYGNVAPLATPWATADPRDTRQTPAGTGVLQLSMDTSASGITVPGSEVAAGASQVVDFPGAPWLLWGGGGIMVASTSSGARNLNVVWSERGMTRGEFLG